MEDEFDPKREELDFEDELVDDDLDSFSGTGKKKLGKPADELDLGDEEESLDELADIEDMDEEEEPEW